MAVPDNWEIPTKLRARIGKTVGRQRTLQEEGHTLILIHQAPHSNEKSRRGACCWITPEGVLRFYPETENFETIFNSYRNRLHHLEKEYKTANTAIQYFNILEEIIPFYFASMRMASAMQAARDAAPTCRQVLLWRDETYEIQREAEILQICAKNALDYHQAKSVEDLSKITYDLSKTSHRLNMMATFFVPMMAVAGLFGMNIHTGFEKSESSLLFWSIAFASILIGVIVNYFFRAPKE